MKKIFAKEAILPILLALGSFLLVSLIYFSPLLQGKVLSMHDVNMASGAAKELQDFHEKTGEWAWWTNSMFGGMPAYMIVGGYSYSLISNLGSFLSNLLPVPVNLFFISMCCFYLFMRVIKVKNWVSITASVAYAFGTYNLVFTEAGHVSKILALAYMPGLLAGVHLILKEKYLFGAFLTALFVGFELQANHLQITYYFTLVILVYVIYEFAIKLKSKKPQVFLKMISAFIIALLIGVGMHTQRLWSAISYSAETIRGKSELTKTTVGKAGLDKEYAFSWSYGISETINILVPNLMGGSSVGELDENSETFGLITSKGVDRATAQRFVASLPLYHGDQSSTAGPAYSGVVVIFLFVLGLFILQSNWRWVHLGLLILLFMLSWGSNFPSLNYLLFDHLPGYNKFRAVSVILTIAHFVLVWGAAFSLNKIIDERTDFSLLKRPLMKSTGVLLVFMLIGYFSLDFVGTRDVDFMNNLKPSFGEEGASQVLNALRSDRASLALSDIYRAIGLIFLSVLLIYFYSKNKIKDLLFSFIILLVVVFDMFSVGKRYFNNSDFVSKLKVKPGVFEPTAADLQILEDKDPNFRVLNLTTNFMSDARDSYFHKSLGGYHGAKLKKYQELVDNQMIKDGRLNMGVINMLNTKYFINNSEAGVQAQINNGALGNAWFVDTLQAVYSADEELDITGNMIVANKAVTQNSFSADSKYYQIPENASISLISYEPNRLVYKSVNSNVSFVVFSEVYYRGNRDWISFVDGVETPHLKVNYLLRGIELPAGNHEIVFEFKPQSVEIGEKIDLAASAGLIVLFGLAFISMIRKEKVKM
ncbi:hypothetical protein [Jiulongibacter sediminis]|uniref:Bacterial membrane protein YfhO n=1 Tax=Jiulongibacter sediminis TaxID=1605367 RepID=A0A0P7C9U3_9BACT|nr:hypothetical protein [Jiulongibacter sediminis]KPM49336.1 hypothetical protein AFM12_01560 [Jiulongibacter sediminis]TBX26388.1 hypothetical protein TK44_01565 [Jiulongibacter sediminis]